MTLVYQCGQRILEGNVFADLPAAVAVGAQHVLATVLPIAHGQADPVVVVGQVAGEIAGIEFDQSALAAGQVDPVQVVPLRIAVVQSDQDGARVLAADAVHQRQCVLIRRQVAAFAGREVDREQAEILVATDVAEIQQRVGQVRPVVLADAARRIAGDGACFTHVACRRDPDVERSLDRRDPAQPAAIGADPHVGPLRVAEQCFARNQFDVFERNRGRTGGGRTTRAGRVAVAGGAGGERE